MDVAPEFDCAGFNAMSKKLKTTTASAENKDITERKKAEEALKESEANFRTFFDTVDDIIVVGNPDGKVIYSNAGIARIRSLRQD